MKETLSNKFTLCCFRIVVVVLPLLYAHKHTHTYISNIVLSKHKVSYFPLLTLRPPQHHTFAHQDTTRPAAEKRRDTTLFIKVL